MRYVKVTIELLPKQFGNHDDDYKVIDDGFKVSVLRAGVTRNTAELIASAADEAVKRSPAVERERDVHPDPAAVCVVDGHALLCDVVGTRPPVIAVVHHEPDPGTPHDSGFTLFLEDLPAVGELAGNLEDGPIVSTRCLRCVVDAWPGAARGLALAGECGEASRDDNGAWRAGVAA